MTSKELQSFSVDQRDADTISKDSKLIEQISKRNLSFLPTILSLTKHVDLQKKSKTLTSKEEEIKKLQAQLKKISFEDGCFLTYRDSNDRISEGEVISSQQKIVLVLNGVPGSLKYFSRIEEYINKTKIRLINVYLPGMDGQDERRGIYVGGINQMSQLISRFMEKLSIPKASLLMHSFGGLIGKYFAGQFPDKVESLIQLATIPITKWNGWKRTEALENSVFSIPADLAFSDLNKDEVRQPIIQVQTDVQNQLRQLSKEEQKPFAQFLLFSPFDFINLLKVRTSVQGGLSGILKQIRQDIHGIPRMIAYSPSDILIDQHLVEEEIMEFVLGNKAIKHKVPSSFSPEFELDRSNLSANFIFRLDDSSHNLHHEKAKELSAIIEFFLKSVDSINGGTQSPRLTPSRL